MADALARFWAKVEKTEGGCWVWTGGTVKGYGRFRAFGRLVLAHRFAWVLANGPLPGEVLVCHTCDNPPCVRFDHLFIGDHAANKADSIAKNRHRGPRGEAHPGAKLTEKDVRAIRARRGTLAEIAADYPVGISTIARIRNGRIWREVGGV